MNCLLYADGENVITLSSEIQSFLASEPEAEPVAWMWNALMDGEVIKQYGQYVPSVFKKSAVPLYLHPPRPEPAREPVKCKRCNGTGFIKTGEIDCYPDGTPYMNGPVDCIDDCPDCHPPRPEPEAEYDLSEVIPLTHRKTKGIIKDRGYNVTGFVLTESVAENKCIVDMSAVRWLTGKEFFEMMHPPVVSPTAEPEAEPVGWLASYPENPDLGNWFCHTNFADYEGVKCEPLYLHPPRPEPARKPMTEEEIGEEILRNADEWSRNFANGFVLGVRFAEKHHGIGGGNE
jgi:hypothetical protein